VEAVPPESSPTQASDSSGARPAAFASDRAASLRAMFPARSGPATPSAGLVPPFGSTGGDTRRATPPDEPGPAPRIGRRLLGLVIAVVLVLLAVGVVANGIRRRVAEPTRSPVAQGVGGVSPAGAVGASLAASGGAAAPVVPA
jgi:hypothetical protein